MTSIGLMSDSSTWASVFFVKDAAASEEAAAAGAKLNDRRLRPCQRTPSLTRMRERGCRSAEGDNDIEATQVMVLPGVTWTSCEHVTSLGVTI